MEHTLESDVTVPLPHPWHMKKKQGVTTKEVKVILDIFQCAAMDLEAQGVNINHTVITYILNFNTVNNNIL